MANSFSYNSIDFSTYGLTLLAPFLPFFSEASAPLINLSISDGGVTAPSNYVSQVFTLPCVVKATSFSDLKSKLDSIATILSVRDEKILTFDIVTDRYWMAKPTGLPGVVGRGSSTAELDISFLCPDPHAFANSATTVDSGSIPGNIDCAVGGTVEAYPVITIVADAPTSYLMVNNETLDIRLEWVASAGDSAALGIGDSVQIDCRPGFMTFGIKRDGEDSFATLMEGVSGKFMQFSAQTTNSVQFVTISGTFSIVWRNRYQ